MKGDIVRHYNCHIAVNERQCGLGLGYAGWAAHASPNNHATNELASWTKWVRHTAAPDLKSV